MNDTAQDHVTLADALSMQITDALRTTIKRHDDTKRRQMQHFSKLLSERDRVYADRLKVCMWYNFEGLMY